MGGGRANSREIMKSEQSPESGDGKLANSPVVSQLGEACKAKSMWSKIAVLGHTPYEEVLDLGHLIGLDTGCAIGWKLTAMELGSGEV